MLVYPPFHLANNYNFELKFTIKMKSNNYQASQFNNSNANYSQVEGSQANYVSTGSPARKPIPAGMLNAKTLAEENLKGFRLRNLQKESDLPLRVN